MTQVLIAPDERLAQVSELVTEPDQGLVDRMIAAALEWEERNPGQLSAAMSAIQMGVPKQVMIMRVAMKKPSNFEPFYNPRIVDYSGASVSAREGCMSVLGSTEFCLRFERVTVEVQDRRLNKQVIEAKGFSARVWQHEVDHMMGFLFNDPGSRELNNNRTREV
jgi:peptide deformylase